MKSTRNIPGAAFCLAAGVLAASCAAGNALSGGAGMGGEESSLQLCMSPFSEKAFKAVHSVTFTLTPNQVINLIGVIVADPAADAFRCTLISVEGLTVFDAIDQAGVISVRKDMVPGTPGDFAKNLFKDVRIIFSKPSGIGNARVELLPDGKTLCRWNEGEIIARIPRDKTFNFEMKLYEAGKRSYKSVVFTCKRANELASSVVLQSFPAPSYSIGLVLLDSEEFSGGGDAFSP